MAPPQLLDAWERTVFMDFGQFSLCGDSDADHADTLTALGPALDSGIGQVGETVVITSPQQCNPAMPLRTELWTGRPELAGWPHAFETTIEVDFGGLRYGSPVDGDAEIPVPEGRYGLRIQGRGFAAVTRPDYAEPDDDWLIQLWPVTERTAPVTLARWTPPPPAPPANVPMDDEIYEFDPDEARKIVLHPRAQLELAVRDFRDVERSWRPGADAKEPEGWYWRAEAHLVEFVADIFDDWEHPMRIPASSRALIRHQLARVERHPHMIDPARQRQRERTVEIARLGLDLIDYFADLFPVAPPRSYKLPRVDVDRARDELTGVISSGMPDRRASHVDVTGWSLRPFDDVRAQWLALPSWIGGPAALVELTRRDEDSIAFRWRWDGPQQPTPVTSVDVRLIEQIDHAVRIEIHHAGIPSAWRGPLKRFWQAAIVLSRPHDRARPFTGAD